MTDRLFTTENLDEYRQNPDIQNALYGVSLLNHDEFMNWYSPPQIRLGERKGRLAETLPSRLPDIEIIHRISKDTMRTLANSVCEQKIGRDYGETAIDNLTEHGFDLLVAVAPDHEELNLRITTGTKGLANRKINHILGFIIVEKGECNQYPEEFCVNLICARAEPLYKKFTGDPHERQRVKGSLLMGAYLYCSKKQGKQMGILELADGYNNVSGFISYTKMGFAVNKALYGYHCFALCENLPMTVSLPDTTYEQIIGRASGKSPLSKAVLKQLDPTGLSLLLPKNRIQTDRQKKVAILCNLLYKMPHIMNLSCRLHSKNDKEEVEMLFTTKEEIRKEKSDTTKRQRALSEGEIDESETIIVAPSLEEIVAKLEDKKAMLIESFEFPEQVVEQLIEQEPDDELLFIQAQAIKANKTKRKRTPLLMDESDDEGKMYVGLGKRMDKRMGKRMDKRKDKGTKKRKYASRSKSQSNSR